MGLVAIVGDATSVAGFRPLGFAVFALERPEEARSLWPQLSGPDCAYSVVFVTEPVYAVLSELIAETADQPLPAVTVIPGVGTAGGVGQAKLTRAIERALGTKLLTEEEGR
jgi:vacuolar-type H+-ATPase subunit F/Vma7